MGKNKLKRFEENENFPTMIQPLLTYPPPDHELRGKWNRYFKNDHPLILELGCGRGEYTIELARLFPDKNFIGIDWKGARLWRGAKTAHEEPVLNAAFLRIQIQNIYAFFGPEEVDQLWITFPDPQLEKSRENKRLTNHRFLEVYRRFLKKDGLIHLKTDSHPFYCYTKEIIEEEKLSIVKETDDLYHFELVDEVLSIHTTYEKIWLKEGKKICYLCFQING